MGLIDVRLSGDITSGLAKLEEKIKGEVLKAGAGAMAHFIQTEAKSLVPVKTGKLRDSIYQVHAEDRSGDDRQVYRVSWNRKKAPHGHLVEFGTSRAPAHPFMRPAADRMEDAIKIGKERIAEKLKGTPE